MLFATSAWRAGSLSLSLSLSIPVLRPLWPEDRVVASRERYIAVDIYHSTNHSTSIRPLRKAYLHMYAYIARRLASRSSFRQIPIRFEIVRANDDDDDDDDDDEPIGQLPELAITITILSVIFLLHALTAIKRWSTTSCSNRRY